MPADPTLSAIATGERLELALVGAWTTAHSETLEALVSAVMPQTSTARMLAINMGDVR